MAKNHLVGIVADHLLANLRKLNRSPLNLLPENRAFNYFKNLNVREVNSSILIHGNLKSKLGLISIAQSSDVENQIYLHLTFDTTIRGSLCVNIAEPNSLEDIVNFVKSYILKYNKLHPFRFK